MWFCCSNKKLPQKEEPPWLTKSNALPNPNKAMSDEPKMGHGPDWSEIHEDILQSVARCLKLYSDYIRLRAVCRTWRSLLPQFPPHQLPTQPPWLIRPRYSANESTTSKSILYPFYDVATWKPLSLHLREASYPGRIIGSSHGSLVFADSDNIFCFNPITKHKVFLAPMSALPDVISFCLSDVGSRRMIFDLYEQKRYTVVSRLFCDDYLSTVILSASPSKDACLALAIINWKGYIGLAYCRCGDSSWKSMPYGDFNPHDVIYSQSEEMFYAVNTIGDVAFISPNTVEMFRNGGSTIIEYDPKYLVMSKDELLLVIRQLEVPPGYNYWKTTGFRVYKFCKAEKGRMRWEPLTDLGDQMVLIGNHSSLASDFGGCKGNSIYFIERHRESCDVGIYDLSNGCIEALQTPWAHHIWFTPNPR